MGSETQRHQGRPPTGPITESESLAKSSERFGALLETVRRDLPRCHVDTKPKPSRNTASQNDPKREQVEAKTSTPCARPIGSVTSGFGARGSGLSADVCSMRNFLVGVLDFVPRSWIEGFMGSFLTSRLGKRAGGPCELLQQACEGIGRAGPAASTT